MAAKIIKAKDLIKDAFNDAGIFDPAEEIEGIDLNKGLTLLNEALTQWSSLSIYIPTFNTITVNVLEGIAQYTVSPLIVGFLEGNLLDSSNLLSTLTLASPANQNTFDYEMSPSRPKYIYIEPRYNLIDISTDEPSSALWFYPTPEDKYKATLMVKQMLVEVDFGTVLNQVPRYYYRALKYELTAELADSYGTTLSPQFERKHQELVSQLKAANKKDMSVKNSNPFIGQRFYRPWGYYVG